MAYNKAREEKKWLLWKEAEERKLRQLGVDEDTIQKLRATDWEDFKVERRFFTHCPDTGAYLDWQAADVIPPAIRTVHDLLDDIDSEKLHRLLLSVDKLTLQIVIWRMEGYSSAEISQKSGLSVSAIDVRIWRLKEKLKIFSNL